MLGLKQEGLAYELGDDWNQQKVSALEQKESIEPNLLKEVAKVLKVSVEATENFDEKTAVNYFNTFHDNSVNNGAVHAFSSTINPIDKWLEALEENKKLYERLLQAEKEKVELLKNLIDKK